MGLDSLIFISKMTCLTVIGIILFFGLIILLSMLLDYLKVTLLQKYWMMADHSG